MAGCASSCAIPTPEVPVLKSSVRTIPVVLARRALPAVAIGSLAALALAACGSSSSAGASAATNSSSVATSAAAETSIALKSVATPNFGTVLEDSAGNALYRFTADSAGHSNCTGACATAWPPVLVPAGDAVVDPTGVTGLGTIIRPDGTKQVAISGVPLYTFADDSPGHIEGNGVEHTWFVASISGGSLATASAAPAGAPAVGGTQAPASATAHAETPHAAPESEHSAPETETHSNPAENSAPAAVKTTAPAAPATSAAAGGGGYGY